MKESFSTKFPNGWRSSHQLFLFALALLLALAGCGGGGGGSSSSDSNGAPVASPSSLVVQQDSQANTGTLSASDPENGPLTFSIVVPSTRGDVAIPDPSVGEFVYTPNPGISGTDNFQFTASDGVGTSNPAAVTIKINAPPVASGTCDFTPTPTNPQAPLSGDLTGSVSDPDDATDTLTFRLVTDGQLGQATVDPTGNFSYSPNNDARGTDQFTYQVEDPSGAASTANVKVIVGDTRIMPLGDSITTGIEKGGTPLLPVEGLRIGYRKPLFDLLTAAGYHFDFVGGSVGDMTGQPFGADVADFDPDSEGHGGWTAKEIADGRTPGIDGVVPWLNANPADVILLHIGTNDFPNTRVADVTAILDNINSWEAANNAPNVKVLVARIINQLNGAINLETNPPGTVNAYNNAIVSMVLDRNDANLRIVDQESTVPPSDIEDDIHPNSTGYGKMANTWFSALSNILDKCP